MTTALCAALTLITVSASDIVPSDPSQLGRPTAALGAEDLQTQIEEIASSAIDAGLVGVQITVSIDGRVWNATHGLAHYEQEQPVTNETLFRAASISKAMTYAAVMELVDQNRLSLDDTLERLLPQSTLAGLPNTDRITVQHLLDHQSGLHNFNGSDGADFYADLLLHPRHGERLIHPSDLISYAARHDAEFLPGEDTGYCSTG